MTKKHDMSLKRIETVNSTIDAGAPFVQAISDLCASDLGETATEVLGAVPMIGGVVKFGALLARWRGARAQKLEDEAYEDVLVRALAALEGGNPQASVDTIREHIENPDFRARVHATVQRMREGQPCADAHAPLGVLIAAGRQRRPDQVFRRVAGILCDVSPEQLQSLRDLLSALAEWPGVVSFAVATTADGHFELKDTRAPNFGVGGGQIPWQNIRLWAPGLDEVISLLHDHDAITLDTPQLDLVGQTVCSLSPVYFKLLSTVLAVDARGAGA